MKAPIVAIDGPAGSGKSTVAKLLAKKLGFTHINTGALYRGVALLAMQEGIALADANAVVARAKMSQLEFLQLPEGNVLHIDGKNVDQEIRAEQVGAGASVVSAHPQVRALLLDLQRELGRGGGVVLEGRDIGTVVFPGAECKIFLTASVDVRAKRRAQELLQLGKIEALEDIKKAIRERDFQDTTRAIAPLKKASDAIEVDTSNIGIDDVIASLEKIVRANAGKL